MSVSLHQAEDSEYVYMWRNLTHQGGSFTFMAASDLNTSAIASTPAISANRKQPPSYICNFLATANLQTFHRSFEEQRPEISTLQATTFRFQDSNKNVLYTPYLKLHQQIYSSTATNIGNQQNKNMETDSAHLPQLATVSQNHVQWPTASTVGNLCWTSGSLHNITLSRYPPNLGGVIKRVDANVNVSCACKECQSETLCDTRPVTGEAQSAAESREKKLKRSFKEIKTATVNKVSSDHEPSYSRQNYHVAVKGLVLEPTNNLLREAIPISSCVQTLEAEQGNQLIAINDLQNLCGIGDELGKAQKLKSKPSAIANADEKSRLNLLTGKLALPPFNFLTNKEARSSKRTRKTSVKPKPKVSESDHSPAAGVCIYRAARGCAVHPRSIAERVRRSRISHRMRVLEAKLPDPVKKWGKRRLYTDEMLERTINYIKWLQESIKVLLCDEITTGDFTGHSDIFNIPSNCNTQIGGFGSRFRKTMATVSPHEEISAV